MKQVLVVVAVLFMASPALANQVFYRVGTASVSNDRGGQIFTDVGGASGVNNGDSGTSIAAGLDLKILDCFLFEGNDILGEIYVNYVKFSEERVVNAISHVAGLGSAPQEVNVSELAVVIAPKYKMNFGKIKPWIIPAGLSFLVNSPPSDKTNYLDIGYHAGIGFEYELIQELSLGIDYRYTMGAGDPGYKFKSTDLGVYVGLNF